MTDATYSPKVYRTDGGDEQVIASGGELNIESGGKITDAGTQASHLANLATAASNADIATAFNTLLLAVEGVGILATS